MNNVVGKTLVVLTLVFCLLLMCFAGAVYTFSGQWRDKAVALESQLTDARQQVNDAIDARNRETENLKAQIQTLTAERNNLQANQQTMQTSLAAVKRQLEAVELERDKAIAEAEVAAAEQAARIAEAGVLNREVQTQADRIASLFAELQQLEDSELNLQRQLAAAEEKEEQNLTSIARLRDLLRANEIDPRKAIITKVPSEAIAVDGYVTRSIKAQNSELLEITIGSDEQLYEDMNVIVYRDNKYICKARVVRVEPDLAICMVNEDTRREQIRKGDRVTTKL